MAIWEVLILSTKLAVYLGLSALLGGFLILLIAPFIQDKLSQARLLWQTYIIKYMAVFALIGVLATILDFFFQVGALSQSGFTGMFDAVMQNMVAQSALGTVAISRLCVFIVGLVFCGMVYWQLTRKITPNFFVTLIVAIIQWGSVGYTFMLSGHTVQLDSLYGYALAVHVIIALSWMGALWPLSAACLHLSPTPLYSLMRQFGHLAIGLVSLLLLAGTLLAWELVGSVGNLFNQIYGQSLLLKLGFVNAILLLAAWHKLKLTPKLLTHSNAAIDMRRSIQIEMLIGLCIFLITAVLTTVLGPQS
ncbi:MULTISPECIES: copper resistance D family protein [Alteromonas]|uniref:Copper resistance protein D n=1 Tax=Alteromonas alba TaxID=2079529 RepID=A0A2S9V8S3_9ALTE|nr:MULTISPECIES: CopD family protein [Alteromonas]PRO72823.1 copper transporter [Alteromonas alba]|tara:strand:- start:1968 stop:2882 length:915 start_codon:yes stop_codon:yes gene_type:complete